MFYEKNINKQKDQKIKQRNECFWRRQSNPGPLTYRMNALSIATPANFEYSSGTFIKLIILKTFAHKNSASRHCLKPVERYLWRIERYIRGKQTWFWQLKLYSFRRLWRTYGRQVSRKTIAKSLAESLTIQQRHSAWTSQKASKVHKLKVGHSSNLKHSKLTWRQSSCDSGEMYQISTSRNGNDLRQLSFWYRALSCGADWFTKGVYIWVTHLHIAVPSVPYATRTPQVKNNMDRN